jgi:hypothetical protein
VVGAYPARPSLRRAAQWDGIIPTKTGPGDGDPFSPDDLRRTVATVKEIRDGLRLPWERYDVVAEGVSEPTATGNATVAEWVDAGATFWVESDWSMGDGAVDRHRRRIEAGPPSP